MTNDLHAKAIMRLIGVTNRQLTYMTSARGLPPFMLPVGVTPNDKRHKAWEPRAVRRYQVAHALMQVVMANGRKGNTPLPDLIRYVAHGPEPEHKRFVALVDGDRVFYADMPGELDPVVQSSAVFALMPPLWPAVDEAMLRLVLPPEAVS
jgi:hypothetical protein